MTTNREAVITADQDNVVEIMQFLLAKTDEYSAEKEGKVNLLDLFMGVHSFHKTIVMLCANMWEDRGGISQDRTFRLADDNWRIAMKECIRTYRSIPKGPDGSPDLFKFEVKQPPRFVQKIQIDPALPQPEQPAN